MNYIQLELNRQVEGCSEHHNVFSGAINRAKFLSLRNGRWFLAKAVTGSHLQTQWPESASELYWQSDSRLLTKLVPTFADKGCHVVSVADTYSHILGFLDRNRYIFFHVAPQLYSRGWVGPVPDPLLLRKSGSSMNGSAARNPGH
jgi:hypothetical protein